jgi:hypothetical protein
MGRVVVVCYRPHEGMGEELRALVLTHVPRLREVGLVTDREPIIAAASDGTVLEVFEWASSDAIAAAHEHPAVLPMWAEFDRVCTYVPVAELPGAADLFTELEPLA